MRSPHPSSPSTRAFLVIVLVGAVAAGAAQAQFGSPIDGSGGPASYVTMYLGEERTFTPSEFNFGYVGTHEGLQSCVNQSIGGNEQGVALCTAQRWQGKARAYVDHRLPVHANDARAGVGLGYVFAERCKDQRMKATHDLVINYTYRRSGHVGIAQQSGTVIDVWANGLTGRGGSLNEADDPANRLIEQIRASTPEEVRYAQNVIDQAVANEPHAALLYAHAHGLSELASGPDRRVDAQITLESIRFSYTNEVAPTANMTVERPDGTQPPAYGARWYHEPFQMVFRVDDDLSCPRTLLVWEPSSPDRTYHPIDFNLTPIRQDVTQEGRHVVAYRVEDHQGHWSEVYSENVALDMGLPVLNWSLNPPEPTGLNGWYIGELNSGSPYVRVSCSDAVSGCYRVEFSKDDGATWTHRWVSLVPHADFYPPWGVTTFRCRAIDMAEHVNQSDCRGEIRYDPIPPSATTACLPRNFPTDRCESQQWNMWWRENVTVNVNCYDAHSGCWYVNVSVDGADPQPYTGPFVISDEGRHAFTYTLRDRVGHNGSGAGTVYVDKTPPSKPVVWERDGRAAVNDTIRFQVTATDALSRVSWYRAWVNGQVMSVAGNGEMGFVNLSWPTGPQCIVVKAVDQAGNWGPESDPVCVNRDPSPPVPAIQDPVATWVYRDGERWMRATGTPVALGPVKFRTTAPDYGDPALASGTQRHWTLLDGANWTPRQGDSWCRPAGLACERTYDPASYLAKRRFTVSAQDAALNTASASVDVDVVDALAHGGVTSGYVPYVMVHWLPHAGAGQFLRYEVHRGLTPDFLATEVTRLGTLGGANDTEWRDKTAGAGVQYYYRVLTHEQDAAGATHVRASVSYPAKAPVATTPGDYPVQSR